MSRPKRRVQAKYHQPRQVPGIPLCSVHKVPKVYRPQRACFQCPECGEVSWPKHEANENPVFGTGDISFIVDVPQNCLWIKSADNVMVQVVPPDGKKVNEFLYSKGGKYHTVLSTTSVTFIE